MGSKFDSVWVPTLQGAFLTSYEGVVNRNWSQPITRRYDAPGEYLKLTDLGTVGAVRQFTGPRQFTTPSIYTETIQNLPFELSMSIDVEDVKRDKLGMFETKAAEMGGKFADHINKLVVSNILANPTCFDTTPFFGTTHPVGAVNQANDLTANGVVSNAVTIGAVPSLATVSSTAPTAVEMANVILDCVTYAFTLVDESGDPINGNAKEWMVVTANPRIYSSAIAAIMSLQLSQGQTNPLYAGLEAKGYKFMADLDPRLGVGDGGSASTHFYLFRTDTEVKPFVWSEEYGIEINFLGDGSYNAVKDNQYIWAAKAVRNTAVGRYQHAFRGTLS